MMKALIAEDPSSKAILDMADKVAKSKATILITGETGVGKELLAHYIHSNSAYAAGPFISVNCAALPEQMIEAILFGYEKGAFTGAVNSYAGKFEQAQHGTLLLDEISEIPLELQAKLLRVLQEREVERLCGKKLIPIDVRVIAATNRDLEAQVAAGLFRKDLYYRLNVVPLHCVALRARPMDIVPLAEYFLAQHAQSLGVAVPQLSHLAKEKLIRYNWPGNIREMDNVIHRTLIMTNGAIINEQNIVLDTSAEAAEHFPSKLKESEAKIILSVLQEADGCRDLAARKLNMSPRTLRYKISKLKSIGLKVP